MLKTLTAVIAAAAGAGLMVALIPPPEAAVAARTPLSSDADLRKPVCMQSWPYYEQSCLSDARQPNGNARSVRVVASAIPLVKRTAHARH
jgi:hypothetical protein